MKMTTTGKKPLIIFGGTFDPIHLGHLHLAKKINEIILPERILLIPCFQSPIRTPNVASASDRLMMSRLAVETIATEIPIAVDDREIMRGGDSFAIDTLRSLREQYDMNQSLCLLMGTDAFNGFTNWHQWQEIIKLCNIIVVNRPSAEKYVHSAEWENFLREHLVLDHDLIKSNSCGHILFVDIDPLPISATEIRDMIKVKQMNSVYALNYLTQNVWQYICDNNLYK